MAEVTLAGVSYPTYEDPESIFTKVYSIGGRIGKSFQINHLDEGVIVKGIKAWMTENTIHGIEVQMTDGTEHQFGSADSKPYKGTVIKDINFHYWEKIDTLEVGYMQESKRDQGCIVYLHIKTSEKNVLELGSKQTNTSQAGPFFVNVPVGSGICCGIHGYSNETTIYGIGFSLLKKIKEATFSDMKYLEEKKNYEIIPVVVKTLQFVNKSSEKQLANYKITAVETSSKTFQSSHTLGAAAGVKMQIGMKDLISLGADARGSYSQTKGKQNTIKIEASYDYDWILTVPPKTTLVAIGRINEIKYESDFEADMKIVLENDKEVIYKERGTFTEMSRKDVSIEVDEKPLE